MVKSHLQPLSFHPCHTTEYCYEGIEFQSPHSTVISLLRFIVTRYRTDRFLLVFQSIFSPTLCPHLTVNTFPRSSGAAVVLSDQRALLSSAQQIPHSFLTPHSNCRACSLSEYRLAWKDEIISSDRQNGVNATLRSNKVALHLRVKFTFNPGVIWASVRIVGELLLYVLCTRYVYLRSLFAYNSPVPVAALSKTWFCGRWLAGVAGSNLAGGTAVFCECCVLSGRGLCVGLITRPEESYRVWLVWVWSWSLDNGEALGPLASVAPWKEELLILHLHVWVLFLMGFKLKTFKIVVHAVIISDLLLMLLLYMK